VDGIDELAQVPEGITREHLLGSLLSDVFRLRPMAQVVGRAGTFFFSLVPPLGALECAVDFKLSHDSYCDLDVA
jgi:hypothetical protein